MYRPAALRTITCVQRQFFLQDAQQLTILIDGVKYELESETFFPKGIVALGDYEAELIDDQKPTHEFTRAYDLIIPDGSTRKFRVIGQTE